MFDNHKDDRWRAGRLACRLNGHQSMERGGVPAPGKTGEVQSQNNWIKPYS